VSLHQTRSFASWVASEMLRRVELWDNNLVIPPALAARAAVLAFGDELMDLKLPNDADSRWLSQGGRDMAAAHLLPRCARSCSGWPTSSRELAKARANPQAARAMTARGLIADRNRGIGFKLCDPSYVAYQRLSSPQRSRRPNSSIVQPGLLQPRRQRCQAGGCAAKSLRLRPHLEVLGVAGNLNAPGAAMQHWHAARTLDDGTQHGLS
jgi:hypothetical protein